MAVFRQASFEYGLSSLELSTLPTGNQTSLTDEEIIAGVNNTKDKLIEKDTSISHMEATKILDEALWYIEAQDNTTIAEVQKMCEWGSGGNFDQKFKNWK